MRSLLVSLALLASCTLFAAGQGEGNRWVEVHLAPGADRHATVQQLKALGFRLVADQSGASLLRGRLPDKSTAPASLAAGVARLAIGPIVPDPTPVTSYTVGLRFTIDAPRQQRFEHYQTMLKRLQQLGFQKAKGLEGEELYDSFMSGSVPAAAAEQMLQVPHVRTLVLVPAGYDLPADEAKPVFVEVRIATAYANRLQGELANKTISQLKTLGFQEAAGYDSAKSTRVLGWLPRGQLAALLRGDPQVELAVPTLPQTNAGPAAGATTALRPIQLVRVLREPAGSEPLKEPAAAPMPEPASLAKVSPDLLTLFQGLPENEQQQPRRVEIILRATPGDDQGARDLLTTAPLGMTLEGRLGPLVAGLIYPGQLALFAASPNVSTIRLPQAATPLVFPPPGKDGDLLPIRFVPIGSESPAKSDQPALVRRRQVQRTAVIANDFRGYESFVGKRLPVRTAVVDVTGERQRDLQPEPALAGEGLGTGTRLALAVNAAAPADELYLLRIGADAPFQVEHIARSIRGEPWRSEAFLHRENEIRAERLRLDRTKTDLRIDRRIVLNNFSDDVDSRKVREDYFKRQAEYDREEAAHLLKIDRFLALIRETRKLKDLSTVVLGLQWLDGHPHLPGARPLPRFLDPALLRSASWVQVVPRTEDQTLAGLVHDATGAGVLAFTTAGPDSAERSDLNFLAWLPHPWTAANRPKDMWQDLPPGAVVQVLVQWREVHSPGWIQKPQEDDYRQPLVPLQVAALRQRDPSGSVLPPDAFEVVARSSGLAERLENHPRYAIYQQLVRFQVPEKSGRHAIRLEGRLPESTFPAGAVQVAGPQYWELAPWLHVEILDPDTRSKGRVVFQNHAGAP